jgi:hypothetical protein
MVVHSYNPSTPETDKGGSWGQSGLYGENLYQKNPKTNENKTKTNQKVKACC